jgi:PKD repeat protein
VPSAAFTFTATNQFRIPCTVTFANQSVNAFSYYWTFGDDSVSEVKNPVHTYHRPGQYEVYLRAYTESRREWASMIRIIQVRDTLATTR